MWQWVKSLGISAFAVLAPVHAVMLAAGVLIVIDLVLGLLAAKKQGIPITSAALSRTVVKMALYQIAIVSGFIAEKFLLSDAIPISKLVAGAIGLVESKSILENLDILNGGSMFKSAVAALASKNDEKKE